MKTKTFFSVRLLVPLALTCVFTLAFITCSDNDGDEPAIDDLLSEETTPIEFEFGTIQDRWDQYILFDYAGSYYVGTDTIDNAYKCTLDLRQGKHRLLWIYGLDNNNYLNQYWNNASNIYYKGVHYNPDEKSFSAYDEYASVGSVKYCEKEIEVTPYLMAAQQIQFTNYISASIQIIITDIPTGTAMPEWVEDAHGWDWVKIGIVTGIPSVKTVFLNSNGYEIQKELSRELYLQVDLEHRWSDQCDESFRDAGLEINSQYYTTLCPLDGLDDIRLNFEIWDVNGNTLPVTALPKFNLRRGYTTILRGPLFSGSTSDWIVSMEQYND